MKDVVSRLIIWDWFDALKCEQIAIITGDFCFVVRKKLTLARIQT